MDCPVCRRGLKATTIGDITFDVCEGGCGGIWFDRFELEKVDEPHEAAGEELLHVERHEAVELDPNTQLNCPRCADRPMFRRFCSVKRQVLIDECPECAGIWLDAGELATIRKQFGSEGDRRQAARQYFDDVFGDRLAAMQAESEEGEKRAQRFARAFRFICPSYYIPGKQGWGAY